MSEYSVPADARRPWSAAGADTDEVDEAPAKKGFLQRLFNRSPALDEAA